MDCVYILHSLHLDRFYVGYSSDLYSRLEYHKKSASDKFTAKANDWNIFLIIA
ncbi:GIY-YIG nuclease family protein [Flavobacterium ardleyense]|uniref:GIY-YIG nuclease family protein n=1 Tax=Flavobacterium ardleyense TaxID=2038737 RepID=UPI00298C95A9|nr:GIY-YIG nuclease family protein [Flavobacterium ardleyense]